MKQETTLTANGIVFTTGDRVTTPSGPGVIVGIDPSDDLEIAVRLTVQRSTDLRLNGVRWFSFRDVVIDHKAPSA